MATRKHFWGALVIIAVWLTVLLIGVTDEAEFLIERPGETIRVPVILGIALLALIATWVVAWFAFRDTSKAASTRAKGEDPAGPSPQEPSSEPPVDHA